MNLKMTLPELAKRRISSTALKRGKESTRQLLYYYEEEFERALHFDFGNAVELYIIDKSAFYNEVAIFDVDELGAVAQAEYEKENGKEATDITRTNIFKAKKEEFEKENDKKYIIPLKGKDSMELIKHLSELVDRHPFREQLHGDYQTAFEWVCPETGLNRYARPDFCKKDERTIIDIKTDAQGDFIRAAGNNDYFLQAFDHIIGATNSGWPSVDHYYWFVLTKKEPYFVDVFELDLDKLLRVEESYYEALLRIRDDIQRGEEIVWHKLPIKKIAPPNWYK